MTGGFDDPRFLIYQLLHHLEAFVSNFSHFAATYNFIIKFNAIMEIQIHMHQYQVKGAPVDGFLKNMLEKSTAAIVEIMALDAIIHMIERIQIAHLDLDWY